MNQEEITGAMRDSCAKAEVQRAVDREMELLQGCLATHRDSIEKLHKRLEKVTSHVEHNVPLQPEVNENMKGTSHPTCPLSTQIYAMRVDLSALTEEIHNILGDLQI
jgi:hypothetical protein